MVNNFLSALILILFPSLLFIADLISFSLIGFGYFLITFFIVELVKKEKLYTLINIIFFISIFSAFKHTLTIDLIITLIVSFLGLKLKNLFTNNNLCCYLLILLYITLNLLYQTLFLGLKLGIFWTLLMVFVIIILVLISLKFLTRYKLDNRF